jgi:hypothetical protein
MNVRIHYTFESLLWQHASPSGWHFISLPVEMAQEIRETTLHSELSKIIPQFTKEEKITIPVKTRVFKVKSKNKEYQVLLNDGQYSCGCIGYGYRGKCKHIDAVAKKQHSPKGA